MRSHIRLSKTLGHLAPLSPGSRQILPQPASAEAVAKFAAKTAARVVVGPVVDLGEAAHAVYNGEYTSAAISLASAGISVATGGASNVVQTAKSVVSAGVKEVAKTQGKELVREVVKSEVKNFTKNEAKELGKKAIEATAKVTVREVLGARGKSAAVTLLKEAGKEQAKSAVRGLVEEAVSEFLKEVGQTFSKQKMKELLLDYARQRGKDIASLSVSQIKEILKDLLMCPDEKVSPDCLVWFHKLGNFVGRVMEKPGDRISAILDSIFG